MPGCWTWARNMFTCGNPKRVSYTKTTPQSDWPARPPEGASISRGPKEGKIDLVVKEDGLFKINVQGLLYEVNGPDEDAFATLYSNQMAAKGRIVGGVRMIPLVIEEAKIKQIESVSRKYLPLVEIKPVWCLKAGIVNTRSEVFHGRIEDQFGPVVVRKVERCACRVLGQRFVSDRVDLLSKALPVF